MSGETEARRQQDWEAGQDPSLIVGPLPGRPGLEELALQGVIASLTEKEALRVQAEAEIGVQEAHLSFSERVARIAEEQLGYWEEVVAKNCNRYSYYFHRESARWGAAFVSWVSDRAGNNNQKLCWGSPTSAAMILQWAEKNQHIIKRPRRGDIFVTRQGVHLHCGIVRSVRGRVFQTVEGNTSKGCGTASGTGWVWSHSRRLSDAYTFIRMSGDC